MDSWLRIFSKIFLSFPGKLQTRSGPYFLISKKKWKIDGAIQNYCQYSSVQYRTFILVQSTTVQSKKVKKKIV
jgi:hypothetical protein